MKLNRTLTSVSLILLLCSCGNNPVKVEPGKTLPKWKEGWLDIHTINTGRGESIFYIFPDGTTMLVDAAGAEDPEKDEIYTITPKPSSKYSSGKVIIRYLDRFLPKKSEGKIDYFMLSHYHGDHMGLLPPDKKKYKTDPDGGFIKTSLTEIGKAYPYRKVIDRGAPDRRASAAWFNEDGRARIANYIKFLEWSATENGTVREAMEVGRDDQIVLAHDASKYPGFSIRNIAAGGNFWTGEANCVDTTYMPTPEECLEYGAKKHNKAAPKINENIFSCVFQLSYGKFDWYAGGDLMYKRREVIPWFDAELPVSKVVKRTDVMKMNHHATGGANSTELCRALKPTVAVIPSWKSVHPNPATIKTLLKVCPDVDMFATYMKDRDNSFLSTEGHIVIRVEPGGESFWVLILDDTNFKYRVKDIFGPYESLE